MALKKQLPITGKPKYWIGMLLFAYAIFHSQTSLAIEASPPEVYKIEGMAGEYLGFNMEDVNNENCRQGPPSYPYVTGLPAGMYSSRCSIYGYPENIGTTRIEFPVESGVWVADIVVTDAGNTNTPPPSEEIPQIQGVLNKYIEFSMNSINSDTCREGAPDYPKVTGLPAGFYSSANCSFYGVPEVVGTTRIEFPIEGGVWVAEIVIGSDGSDDPTPISTPVPNPTPANPASSAAARFLTQATFGPTSGAISYLLSLDSYESWIDEQFATTPNLLLPGTQAIYQAYYEDCLLAVPAKDCPASLAEITTEGGAGDMDTQKAQSRFVWWANAIDGSDQLRQRVAFALSQVLVISDRPLILKTSQFGVADYYDTLIHHSFGNYRDLIEEVSLHPAMGMYLSHIRNEKASPDSNVRPDENFARELMQLFTIGVHQLNLDGSLKKDAQGKSVPTYGQAEIREFAKVFTGWNFANSRWAAWFGGSDRTLPMEAHEEFHDSSEKNLLNGLILPAGQTARQDLEAALDNLFNHPNVGPFIGKQLIQRLVTSNPTPEYISRIATIFNNNGQGERGDLASVVKAILMDPEARFGHTSVANFGKMREPLLRISHLWRAFNATKTDNSYFQWQVPAGVPVYSSLGLTSISQEVLSSPSVFNFFQPNHSPAGPVRKANLVAPEFQIATENIVMKTSNTINDKIQRHQPSNPVYSYLDLANETDIATDLNALLNHLNILLMNGSMSDEMHAIIFSHLADGNFTPDVDGRDAKVRDAISLIVNSPEYLIQK